MIDKVNSQVNIQSMLQTLKAYQAQAGGGVDDAGNKVGGASQPQGASGFTDLIQKKFALCERDSTRIQIQS